MFASLAIRFIENGSSKFSFGQVADFATPLGIAISLKLGYKGIGIDAGRRRHEDAVPQLRAVGMSRTMTTMAMWMKKSRQVWTDVWGGCTSSREADFSSGLDKVVEAGRADCGRSRIHDSLAFSPAY
jgi:hypothetical protein